MSGRVARKTRSSSGASSHPPSRSVFTWWPNIIGYARIILLFLGLRHYESSPACFVAYYLASAALDMADGYVARWLTQSSKFGAALDQTTDRVAVNLLVIVLAILDQSKTHRMYYLWFAALEIGSHLVCICATVAGGKASHKQVASDKPWILQMYYQQRWLLTVLCACQDVFLIGHYCRLTGYQSELAQTAINVALPGFVLKNIINVIQLVEGSKDLASLK